MYLNILETLAVAKSADISYIIIWKNEGTFNPMVVF